MLSKRVPAPAHAVRARAAIPGREDCARTFLTIPQMADRARPPVARQSARTFRRERDRVEFRHRPPAPARRSASSDHPGTRFTEEPETAPAPRGLTTPSPAPTSPASRARPMRSVPRRSAPRRSAPTPRDPWWFRRRPSPADPRRRCKPPSPYSGTSRRPSRRRARVAKPNTPEEPHGGTIATRTSPRTTTGRTRAGRTTGNAIDRDATRVIRHPRVLRVYKGGVAQAVTDTVIATSITVSTILTTIARG